MAVTDGKPFMVTVQIPVPEQDPDQPLNNDEASGVGVSVTAVPGANHAEQVDPQSIPAGLEVTVPPPVPLLETLSLLLKVAPTVLAAFIVTVQVLPVPEQAPLQPRKVPEALAVSVTTVPSPYTAEQVPDEQLIPAGLLCTKPDPAMETSSAWVLLMKVALTVLTASTVTVQEAVPEHPAPDQPVKSETESGVATSVTEVPVSKLAEQVGPQEIPDGLELTVPLPVPALVIVSGKVNLAPTALAASIVTVQVGLVPEQAPVQPAKVAVASGVAVSDTTVPAAYPAEQVAPQEIPDGDEVTAPPPVLVTESP